MFVNILQENLKPHPWRILKQIFFILIKLIDAAEEQENIAQPRAKQDSVYYALYTQ